jgi:mRNA interferase MazF
MAFQPGDVVLVPFPFTDLSATKVRPAIVASGAAYNASEPDLIVGAVTSRLAVATGPFDLILTDWQAAGLQRPSAFKPVLATLDPARVVFRVGALVSADWDGVRRRLREMLDLQ